MAKEYLHLFETNSDFQEAYNGSDYHEPWVSLIEENTKVNYNKTNKEKLLSTPLTFEIQSNGDIKCYSWYQTGLTFEYKKNDNEWTEVTVNRGDENKVIVSVVSGDTVQFRGDNPTYGNPYGSYSGGLCFGDTTCSFSLKGNIMSFINSTDFSSLTTLQSAGTFFFMFQNCQTLTNAGDLLLPATTLTDYCYNYMFSDCSSLTTAPELPATTLANSCYESMFIYCTGMTQAPELPATTLVSNCYSYMFDNCTSLNYIKCLATDISATSCTSGWVADVAQSGTFVAAKDVIWYYSPDGIPEGWTMVNGIARQPLI